SSARTRSMVAAGAHTPREKTFLPFFSCTTQCSPASFTRRVRAASPGGKTTHPSGTFRTLPSAARTVLGVGRGVKVLLLTVPPCVSVQLCLAPAASSTLRTAPVTPALAGWSLVTSRPSVVEPPYILALAFTSAPASTRRRVISTRFIGTFWR